MWLNRPSQGKFVPCISAFLTQKWNVGNMDYVSQGYPHTTETPGLEPLKKPEEILIQLKRFSLSQNGAYTGHEFRWVKSCSSRNHAKINFWVKKALLQGTNFPCVKSCSSRNHAKSTSESSRRLYRARISRFSARVKASRYCTLISKQCFANQRNLNLLVGTRPNLQVELYFPV